MKEEYGMTDRIKRLRERVMSAVPEIDAERAVLVTRSYKETEGEPMAIRRAKAINKILTEMTIYIQNDELICGNHAPRLRMAPLFPEAAFEWVMNEWVKNESVNKLSGERRLESFSISEDTKRKLEEISSYWLNNTVNDTAKGLVPEETRQVMRNSYVLTSHTREDLIFSTGIGHLTPNYELILKKGFNGVKKNAQKCLEKLGVPLSAEDIAKYHFWRGIVITCNAMMVFSKRYAKLARELAIKEKDIRRKAELKQIAENCDWVPGNPARTFWEACQSFWFVHLAIQLEIGGHSISPGRFDQYMYPYLKEDLLAGRITPDQAQELIECLWLKMFELIKLRPSPVTKRLAGESMFQHLIVGGQTRDGEDATNELSYMCLDATAHLRLPQPSLGVRFWRRTPEKFWKKTVEVIKLGIGLPSTFYDETIIPAMLSKGKTIEDARDYAIVGCVELSTQGWEYTRCGGMGDGAYLNLAMCLELALNNGRRLLTGERVAPDTGSLATFKSFEEVKEAFANQVAFFVPHLVLLINDGELANREKLPLPLLSCVVEPSVDRGIDVSAGGAKYTLYTLQPIGIPNVADSLAAIKKLVFDEKVYSGADLLQALKSNWEGYEELRARVIAKTPHYGNDDSYVDELAKWVANIHCKEVAKYKGPSGGSYSAGLYTVVSHMPAGKVVGASLDGRKAGEPLADSISPIHGREQRGPTAVLKSAATFDYSRVGNGALLNMKFSPSVLVGDEGTERMVAMLKTYRDLGGMEAQFNVISKETLRKAQQNPEKYRNLLVRVVGYSAFFVTLDRELQEDLIERTEYAF